MLEIPANLSGVALNSESVWSKIELNLIFTFLTSQVISSGGPLTSARNDNTRNSTLSVDYGDVPRSDSKGVSIKLHNSEIRLMRWLHLYHHHALPP